MTRSIFNNQARIILCGLSNWQNRIVSQLQQPVNIDLLWYENVYDTLAKVAGDYNPNENEHHCYLTCILIDNLTNSEMEIFNKLTEVNCPRGIAVSIVGNHTKMNKARLMGANDSVTLSGLVHLINNEILNPDDKKCKTISNGIISLDGPSHKTASEIIQPDESKLDMDSDIDPIDNPFAFGMKQPGETNKDPVINEEADPRLSQGEMDSLLGN